MELQQLRYAVAVAEARSFTRAAERYRVVQSALSQQIARLERELGVRLFARTSRRVEVTAAGEAFVLRARECLLAAERAGVEAVAAAGEVRGQVAVGIIPTVTAIDLPAVLESFLRTHPQVRILLRAGPSDELAAAVARGDLDVAVLGLPEADRPRGVAGRELVRDRHVAVMAPEHPLAQVAELPLARLADETFVDFPASSPGRLQSDQAFTAAGLRREVAFEVLDPTLIIELVRRGLAIALLPSRVAATAGGLAVVPLVDGPRRVEHLVWSDFHVSPATTVFLAALPHGVPRAAT